LQFAYYESSLVVEFLVTRFGAEKMKAILQDLGQGIEINEAIERQTAVEEAQGTNRLNGLNELNGTNGISQVETNGPLAKIDKEFAEFARGKAEKLAPGLDWEKPEFARTPAQGKPRRGAVRKPALSPRAEEEAWNAW